jgi:hypothetical protein
MTFREEERRIEDALERKIREIGDSRTSLEREYHDWLLANLATDPGWQASGG